MPTDDPTMCAWQRPGRGRRRCTPPHDFNLPPEGGWPRPGRDRRGCTSEGPCFPGVGDPVPDLILHSPGPVLAPSWGRAPSQHGRPPVMEPLPAEFACPWGRVHAGHDGEG